MNEGGDVVSIVGTISRDLLPSGGTAGVNIISVSFAGKAVGNAKITGTVVEVSVCFNQLDSMFARKQSLRTPPCLPVCFA